MLPEVDRQVADRLVNYSDAIAAVAFVGASGLGVAVADPDSRESIASGAQWIALANFVFTLVFSGLLMLLRSWELDLRAGLEPMSPKAMVYSRRLYIARHAVVWFGGMQAILLMFVI